MDNRLQEYLDLKISSAGKMDAEYADLLKAAKQTVVRGGKRFRPYLVHLSYCGYGGHDEKAVLDLAVSQELIHNFLLMHDDVMDRDIVRHGGENISGHYLKRLNNLDSANARHLADSMAILGGDILCSFGHDLILESNFSDALKVQLSKRLNWMIFEVAAGQQLDTLQPARNRRPDMNELLKIYRYKTAGYSFETPLQMGAIAAGQSEKELLRLRDFAIPLGVAYQVVDDLLGMFGDEEVTGKSNTSDLREGKQTILVTFALQQGSTAQKKRLMQLLDERTADEAQVNEAREILEESGARASTLALIQTYTRQSEKTIASLKMADSAKKELLDLITVAANRVK